MFYFFQRYMITIAMIHHNLNIYKYSMCLTGRRRKKGGRAQWVQLYECVSNTAASVVGLVHCLGDGLN